MLLQTTKESSEMGDDEGRSTRSFGEIIDVYI